MRKNVRYAALNIGVLLLGVCLLAFAGAAFEGTLPVAAALGVCLLVAAAMRLAWKEIRRMERLARRQRRMEHAVRVGTAQPRRAAQVQKTPDLRVA